MDTSPTMNLMADPPRSKNPPPDRNLSFTDTSTTPQYFSDFEHAGEEVDYDSTEEDFSFAFWAPSQSKSPDITADELFSHGQILPIYPAFSKFKEDASTQDDMEIFDTTSTSHQETMSDHCEWIPKSAPSSPCTKSRSTGSVQKWVFHECLAGARSQSDGKEKFVFLEKSSMHQSTKVKGKDKASMETTKAQAPQAKVEKKSVKVEKKDSKKTEIDLATAYKSLYGLRRDKGKLKEGEKRKSFLPYFGLFGGGLNAFTKTSYPY